MTIELVHTDGRIWSSTHSGSVFHAFRLNESGKPVALCRKNLMPRTYTTSHDGWSTAEFADSTHGGRCERCVNKLDEHTAAAAAAPADADEPLPQAVLDAAPGEIVITPDDARGSKLCVWRGRAHLGVIFDESEAKLARGAFAAWSSKAQRRDGGVGFFDTKEAAADAIARTWLAAEAKSPDALEAEVAEPAAYSVEVDRHVQARPRVFEDRYAIYQRGVADPVERFALPYRSDRSDRVTLAFRGWSILGELDYVAGPNVFRGRVERTPVQYGNAGHWISAHVVDPSAGVPAEAGGVATAKCGESLIATYDAPRGHALCVACTGDPVEITSERDRTGWLKDGGRPVKVLRALSHYDRIIASVETTDDKPREWHDVRCDATAPSIIFAPEEPATRDEIGAGTLVEAVVISNRPTVQQWRVDRAPWGDDRHTILSDGRGVVSVYTDSLRVIEQPAEAPQPVESVPGTLVDPFTWLRRPARAAD